MYIILLFFEKVNIFYFFGHNKIGDYMKKNYSSIIIIILLTLVIGGIVFYFLKNRNNSKDNSSYQSSRTSTNTSNLTQNETQQSYNLGQEKELEQSKKIEIKEEELANFSTKIYSKDSARQNNISITCNTLNDTIVKNSETFSFCGTLGPASTDKGYQEADIYDKDGNKKKGLGGGNCQVSTTLYNAVLAVPNLEVIERHAHSNYVPYIEKGKDAAVAYGSYDLKFKNNTGNDVKIYCNSSDTEVNVRIVELKTVEV